MTEEHTPPNVDEPVEELTSDSPEAPEANESTGGIGLVAGIIGGAIIGVLGAVAAALWIGFQGPAATTDGSSAPDATASAVSPEPGDLGLQRPVSGTDILPPVQTGGGTLVIENVGGLDAVVVLAEETTYSRAVYVRSGDRVTVPNVAAKTYEILMMLGLGWDASRFTQSAEYQQLDQPIEFAERDVGTSTEYTRLTLSIESASNGAAGLRQIAPFHLFAP
jgi:hypothetical protein